MADVKNPYLESLKANRERLLEKLKNPKLTPEARARVTVHLKGNGLAKNHPDYCEGVEEAIAQLEGAK